MPYRRFVRESKFRHVFGDPYKKAKCYDNIDISKNTWDGGSFCAVNSKFVAVILERAGSFIVLPTDKTGRIEATTPKVSGHKGRILDLQFNPFNTNIIASAGEDARIKLWRIPDEGITEELTESIIDLVGHSKKVGSIQWHPSAENILASAGFDSELIIWDVQNGSPVNVISCHPDVINSFSWNQNGTLIASTCKDKMVRIIDPRKQEVIHSWRAHEGGKPSRAHFVDDKTVVTVGCQQNAEREISLWNLDDLKESMVTHELDAGSGNVLVMYDPILSMIYVAVKGDCNIRYFEISKESPYIHYLSQYSSTLPQRGFGILPKRALKVNSCEIFRLYKLTGTGLCEPISMVVPRRSDSFQPDIYPDVPGDTPALTAEQWLGGDDAEPILISLRNGFVPTEKEFTANTQNADESLFNVAMNAAPQREEDLRKAFYQQQDELHKLRELLKTKELKIRQLEYETMQLKKETNSDDVITDDLIKKSLSTDVIKTPLTLNKENQTTVSENIVDDIITDDKNEASENEIENEEEESDQIIINEETVDTNEQNNAVEVS